MDFKEIKELIKIFDESGLSTGISLLCWGAPGEYGSGMPTVV